jgi:hypothetical protein
MNNHLLSLAILLLMPVSQNQNLPDAYYRLPEQVREQATIIVTGTYALGRSPYVLMPDGTQVWARTSWFRIAKVYRGQVGGRSIPINTSMLPKTKYVSAELEVGREYLVLLRPNARSLKVLKAGEHIPVRDALRDEEIIAILQAQTTEAPTVSNPALRAELLNRVKQTDEMRERLVKCAAEFHECDAPMDRLKKTFDDDAVRLKAIVKQYGWPGNDLVGQDGTWAAFLILLNAELAIQKEMLPLVQDAYHAGKTDGTIYAILLDGIRVAEGKPQVYGTRDKQGGGVYPIEDEANVNKRRAEVGLPPLAEQPKKAGKK